MTDAIAPQPNAEEAKEPAVEKPVAPKVETAAAPAKPAKPSKIEATIRKWASSQTNSPLSRNTPAWNHFQKAVTSLIDTLKE